MKLRYNDVGEPRRCHFTALPGLFRDDPIGVEADKVVEERCQETDVCIFDPYLIQKGVCCKQPVMGSESSDNGVPMSGNSRKINPPKGAN